MMTESYQASSPTERSVVIGEENSNTSFGADGIRRRNGGEWIRFTSLSTTDTDEVQSLIQRHDDQIRGQGQGTGAVEHKKALFG